MMREGINITEDVKTQEKNYIKDKEWNQVTVEDIKAVDKKQTWEYSKV